MPHDDGEVVVVLVKAREMIADPARWTQGAAARDEDGLTVDFDSAEAVKWCARGAVANACGLGLANAILTAGMRL